MISNLKKLSIVLLPTALFIPSLASAAIITCSGACNFNDLINIINNTISWFLKISVSVAAVTFAIAGGTILFNPGSDTARTKAKEMFKKTIIGLVVVLLAWLVIHTVILFLVGPSGIKFIG